MTLEDKEYDIIFVSASDNYNGLDAHGLVGLYRYMKYEMGKNCAFLCTLDQQYPEIEDSYNISSFFNVGVINTFLSTHQTNQDLVSQYAEKGIKKFPKHKKIILGDISDIDVKHMKYIFDTHNSKVYYYNMVNNIYTAYCAYPEWHGCQKYKSSDGCYNCPDLKFTRPSNTVDQHMIHRIWTEKRDFFQNKKYSDNIVYVCASTYSKKQAEDSYLLEGIKKDFVPLKNVYSKVDNEEDILDLRKENRNNSLNKIFSQTQKDFSEYKICYWNSYSADVKRKGFQYFLESLKILKEKYVSEDDFEKILFVFSGDKDSYRKFNKLYPNNILDLLTGVVDEDTINHILMSSDLFCCTTLEDGGPRTIGEAASCGTPIISFDRCISLDLVNDKNGKIIETYDTDSFAKSMADVLFKADEEHNNMCLESLKSFNRFYDDKKIQDTWNRILGE